MIFPLPLGVSYYTCWSTVPSQNIVLGSSVTLSQDVISHIPVAHILQNDPKMDIGCSFLIRQYPLTEEGYNYWLTVQKNSQSLGGLFDLTPADIKGNLHCITHPDLPVFGYVSASTVQDKRIYISNKSLPGWQSDGSIHRTNMRVSLQVFPWIRSMSWYLIIRILLSGPGYLQHLILLHIWWSLRNPAWTAVTRVEQMCSHHFWPPYD